MTAALVLMGILATIHIIVPILRYQRAQKIERFDTEYVRFQTEWVRKRHLRLLSHNSLREISNTFDVNAEYDRISIVQPYRH